MKTYILLFFFLIFSKLSANVVWTEIFPGVWKGIIGIPENYSLLGIIDSKPKTEGLSRLPKTDRPAFLDSIESNISDRKTMLRFPLKKEEQIYGFGLNFKTVHQRGSILNLHVDHYGGADNGRTHAPVPFYVSSEGYGVLINSARYLTVYAGVSVTKDSKNASVPKDRNTDPTWSASPYSDEVSVIVPAEGVEIYVFSGPKPLDAVRRFNLFCGGGALPPRWGLGFTQRTATLYTAEQVENEIDEFEKRGFPLDFVGLEPGWQSKAYPCTFEWDSKRFPEPQKFVDRLLSKNIRVNLWTNPYVSPSSKVYKDIYPYTSSHTVWCGLVPDLVHNNAYEILKRKFKEEHVSLGIGGYKIDEIDGYDRWLWPDVAIFPSGISAEQMRQTYGLWAQKLTMELFRERNQRTYGLIRASNAGAVSMPYVIYNDYYNHKDFITALINSGYCGVLWTPEVRSSNSSEDWVRRVQTVVFSPMAMIDAWNSGTKPWTFEDVSDIVKYYSLLRMQMIPYWYSEFARYHYDGIPPFRGMGLEDNFLFDESKLKLEKNNLEDNPYLESVRHEIKDQYMAGEYLLVAPLFKGQKSRTVVLPRGNWYDFYTGEYVGNGETISVTPGLERIPVYVKDGGIIPMMEPRLHAPKSGEKFNIEIRHYGKSEGSYRLYDDDGETFDYEKGEYSWRKITVLYDKKGKLTGRISKATKGKPNNIGKITWKFMTK